MPDLSDKVSDRPDGVPFPDDVWEMAGKALGSPSFNRDTIRVRIANIIMADRRTRPPASRMEGWRLVPEEPTDEQIAIGLESLAESTQEPMMHIVRDALFCYRRMLAAAPINDTIRNRDETIAAQAAALNWAMDEIDVLSNKLRRIAYPQGMLLLGRSDQRDNYRKAIDAQRAARALASPHQEGTEPK